MWSLCEVRQNVLLIVKPKSFPLYLFFFHLFFDNQILGMSKIIQTFIFLAPYSDKPGMHDFKILKKLVLQDGSILRARYAGRPTRDCLFEDPVMDGKR